jgi:hypothetical protein
LTVRGPGGLLVLDARRPGQSALPGPVGAHREELIVDLSADRIEIPLERDPPAVRRPRGVLVVEGVERDLCLLRSIGVITKISWSPSGFVAITRLLLKAIFRPSARQFGAKSSALEFAVRLTRPLPSGLIVQMSKSPPRRSLENAILPFSPGRPQRRCRPRSRDCGAHDRRRAQTAEHSHHPFDLDLPALSAPDRRGCTTPVAPRQHLTSSGLRAHPSRVNTSPAACSTVPRRASSRKPPEQ